MPAEWAPHYATWISWPHNQETWPGVLDDVERAMANVVAALAPHELVRVNVRDDTEAERVWRRLSSRVARDRILFELIATDDAWIRDYGAIVVHDADSARGCVAVDFEYNAWGGKYPPFDADRAVAGRMAARLGLPRVASRMVLEGGSIDANGEGKGLVTEQCLLNPNRNPGMGRIEIEDRLAGLLGLVDLVWLDGGIAGDDTDGHVDNLARFVDPRRVVAVVTDDTADPNHAALDENRRRLESHRDDEGASLDVLPLPLPAPLIVNGARMPASHANFYVANDVVLVPVFGSPTDETACGILGECFPGRRVVAIDCRALIVGLGAVHCLTQQIPVIVPGSEP
jgi:agmatine deiminase